VGIDFVTHRTTSYVAHLARDRDDLWAVVAPALHGEVRIATRLKAHLGLSAVITLNNKRYVVVGEGEREVLLAPFVLRPQLSLGLTVDLF
jgi:hypothetical protein